MEAHTVAALEFQGPLLRYAEVAREGEGFHLLRLGSIAFDFNLEHVVVDPDAQTREQDTLHEALGDIFAGSRALDLYLTLHPPLCTALFIPLPAHLPAAERESRIERELGLLTPDEESPTLTAELMRPEVLADGEAVNWYHVLALDPHMAGRLEHLTRSLSVSRRRFTLSTSSVAALLKRIARRQAADTPVHTPYRLGIGRYPHHTEFTLMRNQGWHFAHSIPTDTPDDTLYFALAFLHRLNIRLDELGDLYLYGSETESLLEAGRLERTFNLEPLRLDPLTTVEHDAGNLANTTSIETYAPCVGAAMRNVYPS